MRSFSTAIRACCASSSSEAAFSSLSSILMRSSFRSASSLAFKFSSSRTCSCIASISTSSSASSWSMITRVFSRSFIVSRRDFSTSSSEFARVLQDSVFSSSCLRTVASSSASFAISLSFDFSTAASWRACSFSACTRSRVTRSISCRRRAKFPELPPDGDVAGAPSSLPSKRLDASSISLSRLAMRPFLRTRSDCRPSISSFS
mmetsp:Transcript_17151/g.39336  ORF Transcript_17151/g.39336 Transcript_17151/m.39336 type:complete len:204 (-) Transcript_17151:1185-1796(-)